MKIRLPENRRLRWAISLGAPPILFLLGCLGIRWYTFRASAAALREEIAKLDAEEPAWDWDSFLAHRPYIDETQNSYTILAGVRASTSPSVEPEIDLWREVPEGLPIEIAEWAGDYLGERRDALLLARRLARFPNGRHPIKYEPALFMTLLPTVQDARWISGLLAWDMRVNAQLGRFDTCIEDIRAIRNAARSFGDEPFLITFLIRIAVDSAAARAVAEMLAAGEAPETGLSLLQREMLEEAREDYLVRSLRGERAMLLNTMRYYEDGGELSKRYWEVRSMMASGPTKKPNFQQEIARYLVRFEYPPAAKFDQAHMLRRMAEIIDAAKLPAPRRLARMAEADADWKAAAKRGEEGYPDNRNLLTNAMAMNYGKIFGREMAWRARLRCAASGIAAERFRLATGRWPISLSELVPKFADRVEDDPFTDTPLILKSRADGIVIYSAGENGIDDGGDVTGKTETVGLARGDYKYAAPTDIGIRLWDVEKRGRSVR